MRTQTKAILFLVVVGGLLFGLSNGSEKKWGRTETLEVEKTYRPETVRYDDYRNYRMVLHTPSDLERFHEITADELAIKLAAVGDKVDLNFRSLPFLGVETYTFHWAKGNVEATWGEGSIMFWVVLVGTSLGSGLLVLFVVSVFMALVGLKRDYD